ncbi:MAG: M6 family metalloprotease domain-containing protein, partial [Clostridia bacterium]|nr:M6 family metalloprotease domain-containing protein [Clostridia bacterium]
GENIIEASVLKENYDYGEFTFLREMKLSSGQTAYYYESGNEYYSYAHDGDGNLLVKDEDRGTLEYAVSDSGKPVSSGVRYASSAIDITNVAKMQIGEMDLGAIDSQGLDGMTVIDTAPVLASGTNYVSIVNLTIFISFKGETFTPDQTLINMFNGQSNSLKDYYQSMSNDRVNINSQIAYNADNTVYVYQDSERRDYYNTNGSSRWTRESTLITNAIKGAREHFNLGSGVNLDVNNDGYIDSVSVIVHGKSSSTWGSLLWPHSVSLDAVDGENNYTLVNNVKVGKYSFNFSDGVTLGVLAHETAHNLGAPDLYHYGATTQNQDIVTVGKWDLMEMDLDTPQYLLAYMRKNYIGGIADSQIGTINENGVYSLKPVTETSESDVIAYKIPTSKDEYFMVEYRKAGESGYDSMLPGSGLIVYRVKEPEDFSTSRGNMDAVYKGTGNRADEVYVFRPAIQMTGLETFVSDRYNHSRYDIDRAYLSPSNPDFSKVGKEKSLGLYDFETIYYSDGTNSDIVIEALSMNGDSIEFSVKLGKDMVEDDYFDNRIKIVSAEVANTTDFAGVVAEIKFDTLNPRYLSSLQVELQDASGNKIVSNTMNLGRFLAEYNGGMRSANCNFIFASKGNEYTGGMFNYGSFINDNEPKKAVLKIEDADGDEKILGEIAVTDSAGFGWDTIVNSKTELKASIVASTRMTVGVKRDGTVDASGGDTYTSGQWAVEGISGVTSVA